MSPASRSPGPSTARLALIAALVAVAVSPAAADELRGPAPIGPPSIHQTDPTGAWRTARGLDLARTPSDRWPHPAFTPAPLCGSDPRPEDARWRAGFGLPVPDGAINVLMPHDGLLVAGGWFTRIGDEKTPGVATWDGRKWAPLGTYPGISAPELASYSGGLLAMDYSPAVHRWDGRQWSSLPALPPWAAGARDLAALDDRVAVAVQVAAPGQSRSRVLLLTGSGWTTLGGEFAGQMNALAWYDGALYAGGYIDSLDGTPIPPVVRWDGASWQAVGTGPAPESYVWDLAVSGGELVAGGAFYGGSDPWAPWIAVGWNGTRWAALGPGQPQFSGSVWRLRAVGSELFAVGQYLIGWQLSGIARWDGGTWHFGEDSLQVIVADIADYQGALYAGGYLSNEGSRAAPRLVRRKDGRWESPVAPGAAMHGLLGSHFPEIRALISMNGTIVAAGDFEFAGTPGGWLHCPRVATWDGARWTSLGMESFVARYPNDMVVHQGALHAVGYFSSPLESGHAVRLENGVWRVVGPNSARFYNLYCAASAGGWLVVGGLNETDYGGLAYWNGSVWDRLGGGITRGNAVSAITEHGGEVIVGGWFEELGHVPVRNIAAWTPSGWHPLGEGLDDSVYDLLSVNGTLYACGDWGITRWKGGRWDPLWAGGPVYALGWSRGRLVASGYDFPGNVAVLEADSTWHPLGSGLDGAALSIEQQGSSIFFGGRFSAAGGHAAYGFAEYREGSEISPFAIPSLTAAPNPSAEAVSIRYDLATGTHARVEVFDLAGKLVDTPFEGYQGVGPQEVVWRPAPERVRAGVYFARLITDKASKVVRVVRVQ